MLNRISILDRNHIVLTHSITEPSTVCGKEPFSALGEQCAAPGTI